MQILVYKNNKAIEKELNKDTVLNIYFLEKNVFFNKIFYDITKYSFNK